MSQSSARKLHRLKNSHHGRVIADRAMQDFVHTAVRKRPWWLPKILWRGILSIVFNN